MNQAEVEPRSHLGCGKACVILISHDTSELPRHCTRTAFPVPGDPQNTALRGSFCSVFLDGETFLRVGAGPGTVLHPLRQLLNILTALSPRKSRPTVKFQSGRCPTLASPSDTHPPPLGLLCATSCWGKLVSSMSWNRRLYTSLPRRVPLLESPVRRVTFISKSCFKWRTGYRESMVGPDVGVHRDG